MAIKQIQPAERGRLGLFAHIAHLDAEVQATLVNIELAALEDSQFCNVASIEIAERHVVLQQLVEVAQQVQELADQLDVGVLFGGLLVEALHLGALVVGQTGHVGVQLGADGTPLGLVDGVGFRIIDAESQRFGLVESSLPSGIDARTERQTALLHRTCQRIVGNLVAAGRQV